MLFAASLAFKATLMTCLTATSLLTCHMSAGMWAPGAVGLVVGLALLVAVKDSPEKIGYPPVEIVKPKVSCLATSFVTSVRGAYRLPK